MRKLLLSIMMLMACLAFFSIDASAGLKDVRIYINPGHGSWGSNDRHLGTVTHGDANYTDTAGFYESNTNLEKGFGMLEKLIEYGVPFDRTTNQTNSNVARIGAAMDLTQNIVMSRVKNGPYPHDGSKYGAYSRALTEIAAEVEANNFDVFISIHSNALTDGTTTNYPLYLYRGTDSDVRAGDSKNIALKCWPYSIENPHMMWTNYTTSTNIRGDASFWGDDGGDTNSATGITYYGYYGVLKHGTQGFLVEGFFHTYQPARHKAMNWDVCRIEGAAYAKGFRDYFGSADAVTTGDIYGILRSAEETFSHTYYNPNTATLDNYLPINGATVTLKKTDGTVVKTYTTDDEYNGAFVFNKVEPGTYNIVCSHPDYADVTTSVTVEADKVVYPSVKISEGEQIPVQGYYAYDLSLSQSGDDYTLKFKSTGAVDKGYIILTNNTSGTTQSIDLGAVVKGENTKTINAYDLGESATFTWSVALDNPRSTGVELVHSDNSIAYSDASGNYARIGIAIDKDTESDNFGKFYTLTAFSQGLQTFNQDYSRNGSKVVIGIFGQDTDASTSTNKYKRSNRLTVNGGKVYIANYANQNMGVWVHTPGTTTSSQIIGTNYDRAVAFSGTGANRRMYVMHEKTDNTNLGLRYYNVGISDTWTAGSNSPSGSLTSTILANGDGDIIVTDKGLFASQWRANGSNTSDVPSFAFYNNSGTVVYNSNTVESSLNGSIKGGIAISSDLSILAVVDATATNVNVQVYSVTWSGETPSLAYKYSIPLSGTTQVDQMTFDHADNLLIVSQQKGLLVYAVKTPARQTVTAAKSALTLQGKVEPAVRGHYAYGLNMEEGSDSYTLKFKSTGAVDKASIVLINTDTKEETVIDAGAVKEGDNSVVIGMEGNLASETSYNWAVVLDNPASPSTEQILADNTVKYSSDSGSTYAGGGVTIDKDAESDFYGRIYTSTALGQGIQVFNQDLTRNGDKLFGSEFVATNYYSPYRLETDGGKVYITDWSDPHSGIYVYDPAAATPAITNMFTGTISSNGQITNGSTIVGASVTGMSFYGEGADRKMYVFCEDATTGHSANTLLRYDIGTADTWATAPSASYSSILGSPSELFASKNVEVLATEHGVFCSQTRYEDNNTSYAPAFAHMTYDNTINFNSGNDLKDLNGCNAGAIALYNNTFAVVNGNGNIEIYNVSWNGNTPSFTKQYTITIPGTTIICQMEFDVAGNLYVFSAQEGLLVYALKGDARQTRTDAKSSLQLINSIATAIESVEVETPAEYYNLQGVKVDKPEKGIYIKRQGAKTTKVVL